MKCHVEDNWPNESLRITFWRSFTEQQIHVLRLVDAQQTWEAVDASAKPEPTIELPRQAVEALMAAAGDVLPPSAAVDRHLADTITTRDRLIGLLEHCVKMA